MIYLDIYIISQSLGVFDSLAVNSYVNLEPDVLLHKKVRLLFSLPQWKTSEREPISAK